jgi:hypothetical protein
MFYRAFFLLAIIFVFNYPNSILAQDCNCEDIGTIWTLKRYNGNTGNVQNNWRTDPGNTNTSAPEVNDIAKFSAAGSFDWNANAQNEINIAGIILESGVTLNIGRSNPAERPAFNLNGACIVVRSGATLNFTYFTNLTNLNICVEDGGSIVFDADVPGNRETQADDFKFDGVLITLAPSAELIIGNSEVFIIGEGLLINGWTGEDVCTGDPPTAPISGSSGNISWTSDSDDTEVCKILNFSVLPVEYLYFNSTFNPSNRNAQLSWATAKEWENSHFEIERSQNGAKTWEKVGRMEGRGWSDMPVGYEFLDEELPLVGGNVFYRLKQVDFNGSFAYSKVVSVKVPSLQLSKGVWRVYPNPTTGEKFRIDLLNPKAYQGEKIQVRLVTSTAGDKIFTGIDIREISLQLEEVFNRAYNGVYILEISWGQKIEHIKVLKQ